MVFKIRGTSRPIEGNAHLQGMCAFDQELIVVLNGNNSGCLEDSHLS
jgi:hypothetical protein